MWRASSANMLRQRCPVAVLGMKRVTRLPNLMIATVDRYAPGFAKERDSPPGLEPARPGTHIWTNRRRHFPRAAVAQPALLRSARTGVCGLSRAHQGTLSLWIGRTSGWRCHWERQDTTLPMPYFGTSGLFLFFLELLLLLLLSLHLRPFLLRHALRATAAKGLQKCIEIRTCRSRSRAPRLP